MPYLGQTPPPALIISADINDGAVETADLANLAVTTAKINDGAITAAKLGTSAVETAKIADDAVTLAKMAGGTDGNLITFDANGDPAYVATGTAAQVLTSNGAGAAPTFQDAAAAPGVPAGSVFWFGANSPPTGYLECDGSAISRTTYADLFTAISTTWGVGDGSTTFNIPDLRGEFVRGWDNSRGVDSGRSFASAQSDDVKPHSHTFTTYAGSTTGPTNPRGYGTSPEAGSTSTNNSTGTETRPRNIAMLPCIKY